MDFFVMLQAYNLQKRKQQLQCQKEQKKQEEQNEGRNMAANL